MCGTFEEPPTGLIPWFSKTKGNTYATLMHHPVFFGENQRSAQEVAPFSVHVAGVKQEYRRAKLSGARYFDVSGKFESFWRLKL